MNCYDEIYNTIKKLIENKEITSYQIVNVNIKMYINDCIRMYKIVC
ncbi:hypothetical protein GKR10_06100 [Staphylococcus aureus]|nr:hypothetical protein [Staphylococcus aureus]